MRDHLKENTVSGDGVGKMSQVNVAFWPISTSNVLGKTTTPNECIMTLTVATAELVWYLVDA